MPGADEEQVRIVADPLVDVIGTAIRAVQGPRGKEGEAATESRDPLVGEIRGASQLLNVRAAYSVTAGRAAGETAPGRVLRGQGYAIRARVPRPRGGGS